MGVFSVFGGKGKEKEKSGSAYYHRLSTVSAVLKYVCLILCLAILLYGFSFRGSEINSDNFNYLLTYLGEGEVDTESYKTVYFDDNDTNRFAIVRGNLAVVNDSGSAVYTFGGVRCSVDSTLRLDSPQVISGAKYMYIYDLGGTELIVKNALETLHTISYSYPIRGAVATDSGCFAVISEEKTSRSSVYVYDESFRVVYDCAYGSLYTLSVDLNATADRLLTASVDAEEGEFVTTLYLYSTDSEEALAKQRITGEYPYKVAFTENGGFALLTDICLRIYDGNANLKATVDFTDKGITGFNMDKSYFVRQYAISTLSAAVRVEVYSLADGSLAWAKDFENGVRLAKSCGENVFVASGSELFVVSSADGEERATVCEDEAVDVLDIGDGKALIIFGGMAKSLDYGALFERKGNEIWAQ